MYALPCTRHSPQLTQPVQEGVFLYTHNVSPYDGGVYHQAPLLLPLFSLLPDPQSYPIATNLLYTAVDLLSANALAQIADSGQNVATRLFTSSRRHLRWSSLAIAAGFLFNPFTIATCLARSTSALSNLFVLTAIAKAAHGASITFVLSLALAAYMSMHPILLFPPLLVLLYDARAAKTQSKSDVWSFTATHTLSLAAAVGALLSGSAFMTGSWDFLGATYGVRLLFSDLTPNVGLWWYFFIEMFDSFREFFLGVFWLHAASYMPGLTIRLHKQPLFVACTLTGVFAIFTPYPSIADAALYLSLIPLFRHLFPCKLNLYSQEMDTLTHHSDALYILCIRSDTLRFGSWSGLLPPLGICRLWQCQLLLRHHTGLESWLVDYSGRFHVCCVKGRIGCRTT
jgi:phosphatidylinositol glycan class U